MLKRFAPIPLCCLFLAAAAPAPAEEIANHLFARVDASEITGAEYDLHAREAFRRKFYHGKPPEAEVNAMLREVGQSLIDRILLDTEATRRNIVAEPATVAAELAKAERQLQSDPQWALRRSEAIADVSAKIEQRVRADQIEKLIRHVAPTPADTEAFYRANPALFTEPVQNKVSLILLRIDPSSPPEAWDKARGRILELKAQIEMGKTPFEAVARAESKDATAASGGDMGYVHQGMLAPESEEALIPLQIGEISEPVRVLEGEAIFRLDGRKPPNLQPYQAVEARARRLLVERRSEAQWTEFVAGLRAGAKVVIGPAFKKIMSEPAPAAIPAAAPAQ